MMNLGSVPWESSARFLDPSGPSNNTESWICRNSSFRKFSLATSLSGGMLGNVFRCSLLNLLRDETWMSLSLLGQFWFYRLSNWMGMSLVVITWQSECVWGRSRPSSPAPVLQPEPDPLPPPPGCWQGRAEGPTPAGAPPVTSILQVMLVWERGGGGLCNCKLNLKTILNVLFC